MINKHILVGNVGADPETFTSGGGAIVAKFRLATTSREKKGGEWQDRTDWHQIVCFGKTAENVQKYVQKGKQLYVEGSVRHNKYEKDGVTKWSTETVADLVKFLGGGGGGKRDEAPSAKDEPETPDVTIPF